MEREAGYLVRYGSMGHVGMFATDPAVDFAPHRGQEVVVRTHRGEQVGEVLARVERPAQLSDRDPDLPSLVRPATASDLEKARRGTTLRAERFDLCGKILEEEGWPLELIDVETVLDLDTTVLHYLGPRDLDLAPLRARFRTSSGFDVVFEPAGLDPGPSPAVADGGPAQAAARRCGDCNCSDGGCGTRADEPSAIPEAGHGSPVSSDRDGESAHGGCSNCGISRLLAGRCIPRG